MNKENYCRAQGGQRKEEHLNKILSIFLCLGTFSWENASALESPPNFDDIFESSAASGEHQMSDSDEQLFRLINDPCWGNLRNDQNNLLKSELEKVYHETGSLTWLEFPLSPDLPNNPYGIKSWRTYQHQLVYLHYLPFIHFWHKDISLMPYWMYNFTSYMQVPKSETIQLLPCLLEKLSETMLLFQNSPRTLTMDWVDLSSLNNQEHGSTLSLIQYENLPWVALCSYYSGHGDYKCKSWLVWCSEYVRTLVRKYQYLYRLLYDTVEFAHLGTYEQLWITHRFQTNDKDLYNGLSKKENNEILCSNFDQQRLWNILFPKCHHDSIQILLLHPQCTVGFSIHDRYIYYAKIKNNKIKLFNDLFQNRKLEIPKYYEQLEHQYGLKKLAKNQYWEMNLSLDGVRRGLIISNDLFIKMEKLLSQSRFQEKKEVLNEELFYIRMPGEGKWEKSSSIVNKENLTKLQNMLIDISLILESEFLYNFMTKEEERD